MLNRIDATPFLLAAKVVDLELMRLLLDLGADPLLTNEDGTTALLGLRLGCQSGRMRVLEVMKKLLRL